MKKTVTMLVLALALAGCNLKTDDELLTGVWAMPNGEMLRIEAKGMFFTVLADDIPIYVTPLADADNRDGIKNVAMNGSDGQRVWTFKVDQKAGTMTLTMDNGQQPTGNRVRDLTDADRAMIDKALFPDA